MSSADIHLAGRLILHPETGGLDLVHDGCLVLHGTSAEVAYRVGGERRRLSLSPAAGDCRAGHDEAVLAVSNDDLTLSWRLAVSGDGESGQAPIQLQATVSNHSAATLQLDGITVLLVDGRHEHKQAGVDLGGDVSSWRFYQNGWQSWSPTFVRSLLPAPAAGTDIDYTRKHEPHGAAGASILSDTFTIIAGQQYALAAGFITTAQNFSSVRIDGSGTTMRLAAVCAWDGIALAPGDNYPSETLFLAVSPDPFALLDLYTRALAAAMRAHVPVHVPTGWCTWYYYFGENSEDDVLANVQAIRDERLPLEYVLIDDGYETAIGDWTSANRKFPHGMPWLAKRIHAAGLHAGLWLAPFGAGQESRLYAEHPGWVVRNDDGTPVTAWQHAGIEQPLLALDCTNPDVLAWLRSLFRQLAEEWGIELFKIDFCFAAALPGRRFDPAATRAQALRRGLEAIREAIGQRFLLGCGLPLGPGIGVVDGMRIGTDVSFTWRPFALSASEPSTRNALLNVITRFNTHGKLWLNDPDCVLLRRRGDESDMTHAESQSLATIAALSGGMLFSGDNLTTLTSDRRRDLKRLLPPSNQAAKPLDMFQHDEPQLLALSYTGPAGSYLLLGLVNWSGRAANLTLDPQVLRAALGALPVHAFLLPAGRLPRYLGLHDLASAHETWPLPDLPPHATTLVLVKPVCDHPDLLLSSFHVLGGMVEVTAATWQDHRLTVTLDKPGRQTGRLIFAIPATYRLQAVHVNGMRRRLPPRRDRTGIVSIGLTLDDHATVELDFT